MTNVATETEQALMQTNRFRLETVADRERRNWRRDYLFGASILVIAAFLTTLALLAM